MPEKNAKLIFGEETIDFAVPETVSILDMIRKIGLFIPIRYK